jgi:hypothetical protein
MRFRVAGVLVPVRREVVIHIDAPSADAALLEGLRRGLEVRSVSREGRGRDKRANPPPPRTPGEGPSG